MSASTTRGAGPALLVAALLSGCGSGGRAPRTDVTTDPAAEADGWAARMAQLQSRTAAEPAEPFWPYELAREYARRGDSQSAESALLLSLSRQTDYEPALTLLSKLYYESGRHEEAVKALERAVGASSNPDEALLAALALHYEASGRGGLAAQLIRPLESEGDHWRRSGSAVAYVGLRGEDFLECGALARRALDANPASAANQNNYGITRLYDGDPQGAREAFLRAHELDPDLPGPHYNLAIVEKFYFFDDDAARGWWASYLRLASDDPDGLASALGAGAIDPSLATREATDR